MNVLKVAPQDIYTIVVTDVDGDVSVTGTFGNYERAVEWATGAVVALGGAVNGFTAVNLHVEEGETGIVWGWAETDIDCMQAVFVFKSPLQ